MGKTERKGPRRPREQDEGLAQRPFAGGGLSDVRAADRPDCLACQRPLDAREGMSVPALRARRPVSRALGQRQGWMHTACQEAEGKKFHEERWELGTGPDGKPAYLRTVVKSEGLACPIFTDDELQAFVDSGVRS